MEVFTGLNIYLYGHMFVYLSFQYHYHSVLDLIRIHSLLLKKQRRPEKTQSYFQQQAKIIFGFYLDQSRTFAGSEKDSSWVWVSICFLQSFLSVLLSESQGHGSKKLIHGHMNLRSKVIREQHGQNNKQVVGQDLQGKGETIQI